MPPHPSPSPARVNWLFLDMDSYFAAVEQHLRPELRGRPVGVVPVQASGTCVIAATRDAKQLGVKVGTRVAEARRLCPAIELVQARPPVYVELHHAVTAAIEPVAPVHKAYSIDEWAVRLLGDQTDPARAVEVGRRIRETITGTFSPWLSCSIGIAPTRLLAKIGCELVKPGGLRTLETADLPRAIGHLGLEDLTGISRSMAARLRRRGVETPSDLWAITRARAVEIWGSVVGGRWWDAFHGLDEPELETRRRSMGHANVLEPRFRTPEGARKMLVRLTSRVAMRLRDKGYAANALSIHVTDADRRGYAAERPLDGAQDTPSLLRALVRAWEALGPFRAAPCKVAVTASGLEPAARLPRPLFQTAERDADLSRAIDTANQRWGPTALYFGGMLGCDHHMDDKIAFGRIPESQRPPAARRASHVTDDRGGAAAPAPIAGPARHKRIGTAEEHGGL